MEHICFTEEVPNQDMPIHFQLILLARQIYIWVGLGTPKLGNMCVATPTRLVRLAAHMARFTFCNSGTVAHLRPVLTARRTPPPPHQPCCEDLPRWTP